MYRAFAFAALVLTACGGTRVAECNISDCPDDVVDQCQETVASCETNGGSNAQMCVDDVLAAVELACAFDGAFDFEE